MRLNSPPADTGTRPRTRLRSRLARFAVISGVTAAVAAGSLAAASPAAADHGDGRTYCNPGYHCQFFLELGSSRHSEFNSDPDFRNDYFSNGQVVNNNSWAASNSSTQGYESHYYDYAGYSRFLFCVNPGSHVYELPEDLKDDASSLRLRGTTTIPCY